MNTLGYDDLMRINFVKQLNNKYGKDSIKMTNNKQIYLQENTNELRSTFITDEVNETLTNNYEKIHNDYEVLYRYDTRTYALIHFSDIYTNGLTIRPKKIKQYDTLTDLINYLYKNNLIIKEI